MIRKSFHAAFWDSVPIMNLEILHEYRLSLFHDENISHRSIDMYYYWYILAISPCQKQVKDLISRNPEVYKPCPYMQGLMHNA